MVNENNYTDHGLIGLNNQQFHKNLPFLFYTLTINFDAVLFVLRVRTWQRLSRRVKPVYILAKKTKGVDHFKLLVVKDNMITHWHQSVLHCQDLYCTGKQGLRSVYHRGYCIAYEPSENSHCQRGNCDRLDNGIHHKGICQSTSESVVQDAIIPLRVLAFKAIFIYLIFCLQSPI